jgi:hypothetical protein
MLTTGFAAALQISPESAPEMICGKPSDNHVVVNGAWRTFKPLLAASVWRNLLPHEIRSLHKVRLWHVLAASEDQVFAKVVPWRPVLQGFGAFKN